VTIFRLEAASASIPLTIPRKAGYGYEVGYFFIPDRINYDADITYLPVIEQYDTGTEEPVSRNLS